VEKLSGSRSLVASWMRTDRDLAGYALWHISHDPDQDAKTRNRAATLATAGHLHDVEPRFALAAVWQAVGAGDQEQAEAL
jgi:hypothetical protein